MQVKKFRLNDKMIKMPKVNNYFFCIVFQMNKTAEYYVKHSSEIDLTKGTYVPEAPRIQRLTTTDGGHSEQVANSLAKEKPGRLVGSPKKASPSKKVKKTGMFTI